MINLMLFASNVIDGSKTKIILELNGVIAAFHEVVLSTDSFSPVSFTDVIQVNCENTDLRILNSGKNMVLNEFAEAVSSISLWGLV